MGQQHRGREGRKAEGRTHVASGDWREPELAQEVKGEEMQMKLVEPTDSVAWISRNWSPSPTKHIHSELPFREIEPPKLNFTLPTSPYTRLRQRGEQKGNEMGKNYKLLPTSC
jgi:hypothetical protein